MIPLRQIIKEYIGGGWGKDAPDGDHVVPASVIRGTDLDAVQSGLTGKVPNRWHKASNVRSRTLNPGDIVFEVSGGSKDQPVGRSLLLDGARLALFKSAVIPASFCKKITPNQEKVHSRFLQAHFQLAWSDRRIVQWQVQSTGISNFNFESFLDDFLIDLPPLPIQRRIAGILSAYDDLIENCQRRIAILEAMARALYREWFVAFRFPGHEAHPRVPSPLGDIPEGWEVMKLDDIITAYIGGGWGKEALEEDHTEPAFVIRGTDIPRARHSQVDGIPHRFHTASNLRSRRLMSGDIVFEVSGGSKGQPVGRTLLVTPQLLAALDGDVICASFCKRVQVDIEGYGSELLFLSFLEGYESGEIEQYQVQSTGISNFKWTEYIANTSRVVPPVALRDMFRGLVSPMLTQIALLGVKAQNLRRTRDLLLPRLLSGQIDVEGLAS